MSNHEISHAHHADRLIEDHGATNAAAATLLVVGPRAIRAYAAAKGADMEMFAPLLAEAVAAWVTARGGCPRAVAEAVQKLEAGPTPSFHVFKADTPTTLH